MKKMPRSFLLPDDVIEWIDGNSTGDMSRTAFVIKALRMLMNINFEKIKEVGETLGLTESRLISVSLARFLDLPVEEQFKEMAKYYMKFVEEEKKK